MKTVFEKNFRKVFFGIITVSLIMGGFFVGPYYARAATIVSDTFGTGSTSTTVSGFSEGGNVGDDAESRAFGSLNNSASPEGGRFAAMLGDNGYICKTVNASGYTNVQVSYYWRGDSDSGSASEDGIVEFKPSFGNNCADASDWTELANHDMRDDTFWTFQPPIANAGLNDTSFLIRFRDSTHNSNEDFRVDGLLITGDPIPPILILDKVVSGGPANQESQWILMASDPSLPAGILGPGAPGNADVVSGPTFPAGTYTLSESVGPAGYSAGQWSCIGGIQNGNQITIGWDEAVVCTITNTYDPPLPSADDFTILYVGCTGISGAGQTIFSWSYSDGGAGAQQSFRLQVDDDAFFNSPEVDSGVINGTSNQQSALMYLAQVSGAIRYNVSYYWRVDVCNTSGACSGWTGAPFYQQTGHPSPFPSFSFSPESPTPEAIVSFTNTSVCYNGIGQVACQSYAWDFGDSASSTDSNPTHAFAQEGTFDVTLKAYDEVGYCEAGQSVGVGPSNQSSPRWKEVSPF